MHILQGSDMTYWKLEMKMIPHIKIAFFKTVTLSPALLTLTREAHRAAAGGND